MITDENRELLSKILLHSIPTLFLGAGFSIGSKNKNPVMDGKDLKTHIIKELLENKVNQKQLEEIKGYDLKDVCESVYSTYGKIEGKELLSDLLVKCFLDTYPTKDGFHLKLTCYPWKNIFTVNVDDLVENIFSINKEKIFIQNSRKLKEEPDSMPILYKLHGCVKNPKEGFVFSISEYDELITKRLDARLNKFTQDLLNNNVIFIGASMDEQDIRYYLKIYEDAGYKYRKNQIVFIDPSPSFKLINAVKNLGAILIEANTEEFLNFVFDLHYQPNELDRTRFSLSYNGIFRLSEIEKHYEIPYESKLYFGDNCSWQDVSDNWIFETQSIQNARSELDTFLSQNNSTSCFSIYGPIFSGKSCILKELGYYLSSKGYEVLEYRGRQLNLDALKKYIEKTPANHIAFIIDSAAYYYDKIEKILKWSINNKKVIILTASRSYFHKRKKYYLEGESFFEYEVVDKINRKDSITIANKLDEKSHLSFLSSKDFNSRIHYILQRQSIINFIIGLTYNNVSKRIKIQYEKCLPKLSNDEQILLLELAIFDTLEIEYYPRELFVERYGSCINFDSDINIMEMGIIDLARMDEKGICLRNNLIIKSVIAKYKDDIPDTVIKILITISRYVEEKKANVWYYIFQCLLKEDLLKDRLKLDFEKINNLFLSVKNYYRETSYYWLQLGILYQNNKDYSSAFTYLQQSYSIRPYSYQIQHAIARNYLKAANSIFDLPEAIAHFSEGEKLMKELIDSKDYYKIKAKPFSISSYIAEKIRFTNIHGLTPTDKDLKYIINVLSSVKDQKSDYIENAFASFYYFLKKYDKLSLLKISMDSRFLKYLASDVELKDIDDFIDPIIESIN